MAVFSIYLQQDNLTVVIEPVAISTAETATEQTCLERWDHLRLVNQAERDYKLMADNQELNIEFFATTGCADSFRD